ncbi:TPA: transglycosylase domain-containing protein [Burkholderia cenocepacia]|uniref:penicillin-binding protein 1A n=1 Tax=Burkholderia cenocepacia TaxID=95486 RepID=UPI001B9ABE1C|nr:transglycosylase domain-containing protein [Burkholderia cenocepacia]MBR8200010.1 transglycosylase domain-containing protein [Burkholderia cenocepacia]HDV6327128.1 transglycosylase domain-containing protein [Burkholderia cenocepacia]HDV6352950.1 transglycosylase domain-containing protein [Burkholderia cenocepacia]
MNRFVPFLRDAWLRCRARVTPLAAACRTRVRALGAGTLHRLRHPTRRGVALTLAAIPVLGLLVLLAFVPFTPSIGDIRKARIDRPARVLSADGQLIAEFRPVNREWVPLKQISPHMVDALIATEDHRFYAHHGIDWRRTLAAGLHTFSGDRQGGSTITQQLARNLYPDEVGRAPTLTRKVKELITAFKIEAVYSKDEILETYLNTVPFLYNAYGVEMAARTYFGKSADQLDLTESATLVGMLKGNSYYNPVLNPERAVQRRNVVLGRMAQMGMLSPQQFAKLQRQPLRVDFEPQTSQPGLAPHFAVQLRKWLIAWADRNNYDLYSDGLVVRTTLDARLQDMATQALTRQTERLQAIADGAWRGPSGCGLRNDLFRGFMRQTPEYRQARDTELADVATLKQLGANRDFVRALCERKTQVQAGFVAIDPRNGAIRAWVGSPDFGSEPFDHVVQARRQPGSTFKPFVYGAAFADGMRPGDTFVDGPVAIPIDGRAVWRPTDAEPPTGAPMTLRDGLALSRNRITAQVMQREGAAKVAQLARAMGVRDSPLDAVPSLALGTSPVTLKEMVSAYGTIANHGVYVAPQMITRIEDRDGKVLAAFGSAPPERALPAPAALTLVDAMRGVVDYGTGADIRSRYGIRIDVAGKTGTTQDNTDGWFILMHPQLVAGAWVGFDDGSVTLRSDYWGAGAHSALPIVGSFYDAALRARAIDPHVQFSPDFRPRSAPAPKRRAPQHSGLFDWLRFFR